MGDDLGGVRTTLTGIGHVELRVRDLNETARFYREVFALQCQPPRRPYDRVCVCRGVPASGEPPFCIVLTEGLPSGMNLAGLDHLGVRVASETEVREIHDRATRLGCRRTLPRLFDGVFQMFVFDPNGYKIEVVANNGDHGDTGTDCV